MPRVLVATLNPGTGGVLSMTRFAVAALRHHGYEPVLAHYMPFSRKPSLSVPSHWLGRRVPTAVRGWMDGDVESHGLGAWLPELEFTQYLPDDRWDRLIAGTDAHLVVSGNALAATAFHRRGMPYLAWVATDWSGDRVDRVRRYPWPRRLLDRLVVRPVTRQLEASILGQGRILALSRYTAGMLREAGRLRADPATLPMPVETWPADLPARTAPGLIGFSGRFVDPRKNVGLFLEVLALLRAGGQDVRGVLVGDEASQDLRRRAAELGLSDHIEFCAPLAQAALRERLRTLDVFLLPSHQEGLCIAALEAMSCGVPVVSTRCGGPEEFVIDGQTGQLGTSAIELSAHLGRIVQDRAWRHRLGEGARALVLSHYSVERARGILQQQLLTTFPQLEGSQT